VILNKFYFIFKKSVKEQCYFEIIHSRGLLKNTGSDHKSLSSCKKRKQETCPTVMQRLFNKIDTSMVIKNEGKRMCLI